MLMYNRNCLVQVLIQGDTHVLQFVSHRTCDLESIILSHIATAVACCKHSLFHSICERSDHSIEEWGLFRSVSHLQTVGDESEV